MLVNCGTYYLEAVYKGRPQNFGHFRPLVRRALPRTHGSARPPPPFVYKIPYSRARAWPSGCVARAKVSCIQPPPLRGAWLPIILKHEAPPRKILGGLGPPRIFQGGPLLALESTDYTLL